MYDPVAHADAHYMNTYGEELDQERRLSRAIIDPSQLVDDTYDPFEIETIHGIESTPMTIKEEQFGNWPFTRAGTILLALLVIGFIAVANVSKGERTDENVTSDIARVTR